MALPFIVFGLLLVIATALLIIGILNWLNENGVGIIPISGLVFLLTGGLLWTNGLQTNTVTGYVDSATGTTVDYLTLSVAEGEPLWIIANILLFGGFILMLVGVGKILELRRTNNVEEEYY